ncbi:MAG: hypothetical protein KAK02_04315, partial [Desulfobulbaceae bacterium]|nr:hypothetical protein [Desulfobulbaceae bacterium]
MRRFARQAVFGPAATPPMITIFLLIVFILRCYATSFGADSLLQADKKTLRNKAPREKSCLWNVAFILSNTLFWKIQPVDFLHMHKIFLDRRVGGSYNSICRTNKKAMGQLFTLAEN